MKWQEILKDQPQEELDLEDAKSDLENILLPAAAALAGGKDDE